MRNETFMKTIITLLSFQLRTRLKTILIWGFAMAFFMCMYMAFFSTMQEIAQVKFELLPQAYLQLMGIEDLATAGNYDQYFAMICQLLMIFVSGFAVTFSMNLILKEEKNKSIEFLYSLHVTRTQIYVSKLLLSLAAVIFVIALIIGSGVLMGIVVGDATFHMFDVIRQGLLCALIPIIFLFIAHFAVSCSARYTSAAAGCAVLFVSYMLGYLGTILEGKADWLLWLSPFDLFSASNALHPDHTLYTALGAYALLCCLCIAAGLFAYRKRDFHL